MAVQISDLPEEILIEIFRLLDAQSVKNAALVCKDWNKVISTTPAIMKKFILRVYTYALWFDDGRLKEKFEQLISLERHFTTFEVFVSSNFEESRLFDVLERFGRNLINIELNFTKVKSEAMLKFLKLMPALEELSLSVANLECESSSAEGLLEGRVTLEKLKKLVVRRECKLFQLIAAPYLVKLETPEFVIQGEEGLFVAKIIENFLKASPKLESLKSDFDFFEAMNLEFPFRLKELVDWKSFALTDNIKNFLLSQAATVESLEAYGHDPEFFELVLTKFQWLKNFESNLHKLPKSAEFYQTLKPLPLLTEITSDEGFSCEAAMRAVLGNCPGLLKLKCVKDEELPNHLNFIAEHNKKLQVLEIFTIGELDNGTDEDGDEEDTYEEDTDEDEDEDTDEDEDEDRETDATFPCLEELTVHKVKAFKKFVAFLRAHRTIETLRIRKLEYCDLSYCEDKLFTRTNLKHLHITGTKSAVERVYSSIRLNGSGTLKTLVVCARGETDSCYEDEVYCSYCSEIDHRISEFSFDFYSGFRLRGELFDNKPIQEYTSYD